MSIGREPSSQSREASSPARGVTLPRSPSGRERPETERMRGRGLLGAPALLLSYSPTPSLRSLS
jgi:hypothetical protein